MTAASGGLSKSGFWYDNGDMSESANATVSARRFYWSVFLFFPLSAQQETKESSLHLWNAEYKEGAWRLLYPIKSCEISSSHSGIFDNSGLWDVLRCVAILLVSSSIKYQAVKGDWLAAYVEGKRFLRNVWKHRHSITSQKTRIHQIRLHG